MLSKPIRLRGLKYLLRRYEHTNRSVEAYTASWIEIPLSEELESLLPVEAYTASWIEIKSQKLQSRILMSKPIRLRGLKLV